MAEKNIIRSSSTISADIVDTITKYNEAYKAKKMDDIIALETTLKNLEGEYAGAMSIETYRQLKASTPLDSVLNAIKAYGYKVIGHRDAKDDNGNITGIEQIARLKQIDLLRFCRVNDLPVVWSYMLDKLNLLLTMRAAKELDIDTKMVEKNFAIQEVSRKQELGAMPTSNNAICKQIQQILDKLIFMPNDKGENTHKANSHDVSFLLMLYTKKGRELLTVATAKSNFLRSILTDVCHRIVLGKKYGLEYKTIKDKLTTPVVVKAAEKVVATNVVKTKGKSAVVADVAKEAVSA